MKFLKELTHSCELWIYKNIIKTVMIFSGFFILFLTFIDIPSIENSFEKMEITDAVGEFYVRMLISILLISLITFFWKKGVRRRNYLIAILSAKGLIKGLLEKNVLLIKEKNQIALQTYKLIAVAEEKKAVLGLSVWIKNIEKLISKREHLITELENSENELGELEKEKIVMEYSLSEYLN